MPKKGSSRNRKWDDPLLAIYGAYGVKSHFFLFLTKEHLLYLCHPDEKDSISSLYLTDKVTTAHIHIDSIWIAKEKDIYVHSLLNPTKQLRKYTFDSNVIEIKSKNQAVMIFLQNRMCFRYLGDKNQDRFQYPIFDFQSFIQNPLSDFIMLHNTPLQNIRIVKNQVYFTLMNKDLNEKNLHCIYQSDIRQLQELQNVKDAQNQFSSTIQTSSAANFIFCFDTIIMDEVVDAFIIIEQKNNNFSYPNPNSISTSVFPIENKIKINFIAAHLNKFPFTNQYIHFFLDIINQFYYDVQLEFVLGNYFFNTFLNDPELDFEDIFCLLELLLIRQQKSIMNHTIISSQQAEKLQIYEDTKPFKPPLISTITQLWENATKYKPPKEKMPYYHFILINLIPYTDNEKSKTSLFPILDFFFQNLELYQTDGIPDIKMTEIVINSIYSSVLLHPENDDNKSILSHSLNLYKLLCGTKHDTKTYELKEKLKDIILLIYLYNSNTNTNIIEPYVKSEIMNEIDKVIIENQFCPYDVLIQKIEEQLSKSYPFKISKGKKDELKDKARHLYRSNIELYRNEARIKVLDNSYKKPFYSGFRKISYQ